MEKSKVSKYIPDDVAFSILSKLPLKSWKRFECVRKSWSRLLENHYFMSMFRSNFLSNLHCSSYHDQASLFLKFIDSERIQEVLYSLSGKRFENKVKLDFSNPFEGEFNIFGFGSINGIFCLHNRWELVLWNPSTQEFKAIPPSASESSVSYFDKVTNSVFCDLQGFGYDRVTDDYKVIRRVYPSCRLDLLKKPILDSLWEIYSLRSNSWRKLDIDITPSWPFPDTTQVYVDGVCHWLCRDYHQYLDKDNDPLRPCPFGPCLASINLSNDVVFTTDIPSDVQPSFNVAKFLTMVVLNGYITLISYHGDKEISIHVVILGELGRKESWIKLLIIEPLTSVERPIGIGTKGEIFFVQKDENDEELTWLAWFDLSTQMIENLGFTRQLHASQIVIHQESIRPIERINN